jgi:ferritin-like metal-binding protein YciE
LLDKTLDEEKETDAKLTELAEAMSVEDAPEEDEEDEEKPARARGAKA